MATEGKRLVVNEAKIAARVMDGEAVIIDLATGLYYSMDGVGGDVWELIEHGHAVSQIAEAVAVRYDVTLERARADLDKLVGALAEQGLVEEADGELPAFDPDPPGERHEYAAPELHTYHDMGDLLALDPPMPGLAEGEWRGADEGNAEDRDA